MYILNVSMVYIYNASEARLNVCTYTDVNKNVA